MRYIPNTDADRQAMLRRIGMPDTDALFADVPPEVRLRRPLDLPPALAEMDLLRHLGELANKTTSTDQATCFLGAGAYDHYSPVLVDALIQRGEFLTAYTPYQPEISQGTLQAIYEFQSLICELTGLDIANASLYDGASACAEAAVMAVTATDRARVLLSRAMHPDYRAVVRTYLAGQSVEVVDVPEKDGVTDLAALGDLVTDATAGVLIQHPNFFGNLEPVREIEKVAHGKGGLFVVAADPISLGILEAPGRYGADIAVGEGQPLGVPISYGGPYVGFLAARSALQRRMPGRIVGATRDVKGRRAFVLTLQTREQHIRREKATSNICTNQALIATAATIYMTVVGKHGLVETARQALAKSAYLHQRVARLGRYGPAFKQPFWREFAIRFDGPVDRVIDQLAERNILAGYPLARDYPEYKDCFLVAVTEKRTRTEIDHFVAQLEEVL